MNANDSQSIASPGPWLADWPSEGLQNVDRCPVCGAPDREILLNGLVDVLFSVANGRWNLQQCARCWCAYLDPRPDRETIGQAYGSYYTHVTGAGKERLDTRSGPLRTLQTALANGYLNHRFGTQRYPASGWGRVAAAMLPRKREQLDAQFRFLPRAKPGQRLLDVGCGNGDFLELAVEMGWEVVGLEPDPLAVVAARARGFNVIEGQIETVVGMALRFDAITVSHVIEHVHDPAAFLASANTLLPQGGALYVDTPNILSVGAEAFGPSWRGLEPPRHLVIFNLPALRELLDKVGFGRVETKRRKSVRRFMHDSSVAIQESLEAHGEGTRRAGFVARARMLLLPVPVEQDEFITLVAYKGGA